MKKSSILILLALLAFGQTAWAQLSGSGTATDPYLITSTADWNTLAYNVNHGNTYENEYFRLDANNIEVTTMVGTDIITNYFAGTFDGNGHTITVNYNPSSVQHTAPFRDVKGATIKNLHVTGTITTDRNGPGGIVGNNFGVTLINCRSSVSITSSKNGDAGVGGLIAYTKGSLPTTIEGCVFDGTLISENGAKNFGGFIGWLNCSDGATVSITNSCFHPESIYNILSSSGCKTFVRASDSHLNNNVSFTNCYFTLPLSVDYSQGKEAHFITPGSYVTVAFASSGTNYNTSGLTIYGDNHGMSYNNGIIIDLFAGNAEDVSLNLSCTPPAGYAVSGYTASEGTLTGSSNLYTLTMPDNDVTISATLVVADWADLASGLSENDPYMIYTPEQLNLFVTRVNDGNSYGNYYFKLGDNITYDYSSLADNESNFTTIGTSSNSFRGHFDGNGKTISGIRIRQGNSDNQGLFGFIENEAELKNITLADAEIVGKEYVGGIVAWNKGTVTYCTVANDVTIGATVANASNHGGIVGQNDGFSATNRATLSHCTSSATLTVFHEYSSARYGGLVGINYGVMNDNLAIGATVAKASGSAAAIAGMKDGSYFVMQRNYYVNCTVAGVTNATGVGCGNNNSVSDLNNANNPDGAVPGNVRTITAPTDWTIQNPDGWVFIASPLTATVAPDATTVENVILSSEYDLYRLNPSNTMWENYKSHEDNDSHFHFSLENGRGYLYATQAGTTIKFIGENASAYNQNSTKDVTLDEGFNLVGNPFPRSAYINKPYYTLNSNGSAVLTTSESAATPIAPCYSVVVEATESGTLTFSTTPQTVNAINKSNLSIVLAQANNNTRGASTLLDNAIVTFNEGEQLGKFYFGTQDANIYLPQNGKDYAIAFSEGQGEMPLNFKANENGTYTLTVNPEGVELAYLHLIDNMTGADIDLLQTPNYSFNANVMDYESRFRLVFVAGSVFEDADGDNETFAFCLNGNWIISNEGDATLQVIDALGRIISNESISGTVSKSINAPAGVYVLRLINGDDVKTQKIVVR